MGSLREGPDEHDGVSRALVKPRRARRDDSRDGKDAAAALGPVLAAEVPAGKEVGKWAAASTRQLLRRESSEGK